MRKSLVLNFDILKNFNITVEEFLFLYNISQNKEISIINVDINELQNKKLIKIIKNKDEKNYILREKSQKLIEFLTVEIDNSLKKNKTIVKKSDRAINADIGERINDFRIKWKGLKPGFGSMGSLKACKLKLTRWMKENPDYSFDNILEAADIYISSLNGDYRFLQRADYFIFKQENNREESSRLSAYVDEIGVSNNDEWTSTLN